MPPKGKDRMLCERISDKNLTNCCHFSWHWLELKICRSEISNKKVKNWNLIQGDFSLFKCLLFRELSNFCHLQIGYTWSLLTTRIPGVDILPPKTGTGVEQAIVGKVEGGGDIGQAELLQRRQECKLQSGSVQWGPSAFYAEYWPSKANIPDVTWIKPPWFFSLLETQTWPLSDTSSYANAPDLFWPIESMYGTCCSSLLC